ncbi:hypothetical protein GMSM_34320 [Geomonas sp. Red276]
MNKKRGWAVSIPGKAGVHPRVPASAPSLIRALYQRQRKGHTGSPLADRVLFSARVQWTSFYPRLAPGCSEPPPGRGAAAEKVFRHLLELDRRLNWAADREGRGGGRTLGGEAKAEAGVSLPLPSSPHDADLRGMVVEVMRLTVQLWAESTGSTRAELARRSGQWSVYVNEDGWERTQGLDRYLDIVTLPSHPRIRKVLSTADFVVVSCLEPAPLRVRLQDSLAGLRDACSSGA